MSIQADIIEIENLYDKWQGQVDLLEAKVAEIRQDQWQQEDIKQDLLKEIRQVESDLQEINNGFHQSSEVLKSATFNRDVLVNKRVKLQEREKIQKELDQMPTWQELVLEKLKNQYNNIDQFIEGLSTFGDAEYTRQNGQPDYLFKWLEKQKLFDDIKNEIAQHNIRDDNDEVKKTINLSSYTHLANSFINEKNFIRDISK